MTIQPSPSDLLRVLQAQHDANGQLLRMIAGMLDKSAPEPLLTFPPPRPEAPAPAKASPAAPAKKLRRVEGPARRPPAVLKLGSVEVQTTERRAAIVRAFIDQPRTLAAMVEAGFAPNTNAMMRQVVDINRDLQFAGSVFRIKPGARPPREGGRGSVAPMYYVEGCVDDIAPSPEPAQAPETAGSAAQLSGNAAQPSPVVEPTEHEDVDGSASARPHSAESEPAIPSMPGDAGMGQGSEAEIRIAVVPPGEMAGSAVRDGAQDSNLATDEALSPEKLAAVDVLRCRVFGPSGSVYVSTRAARALDVLKHGDLFGLDHVAAKAKIPSASDCRHTLRIEEASLRSIGLEVWSDKFNARLREAS